MVFRCLFYYYCILTQGTWSLELFSTLFFLGFVAIAFTKKGRKGACPSNFMWNGQSFRLVKKWVANSGSFLQILHLYPMLDKIAHLCQTFFNENVYTSSLLNVNFRYKMSSFWQNIYLFKGQQILEVNFLVLISSEKTQKSIPNSTLALRAEFVFCFFR